MLCLPEDTRVSCSTHCGPLERKGFAWVILPVTVTSAVLAAPWKHRDHSFLYQTGHLLMEKSQIYREGFVSRQRLLQVIGVTEVNKRMREGSGLREEEKET